MGCAVVVNWKWRMKAEQLNLMDRIKLMDLEVVIIIFTDLK